VNSFSLTKEQASVIAKALYPPTNYLVRLRNRMHERGFPHDDPLYVLVCEAYDKVQQLSMHIHYLSCDGVGRPPRPTAPPASTPPAGDRSG
jgi:hypothetical protein